MINEDIELKLLANSPIQIDGIGYFQLPTVNEIIEMGYSNYQNHLNMINFSKGIVSEEQNAESFSHLDVLAMSCFHNVPFREIAKNAFKLFLNKELRVTRIDDSYVIYFDDLEHGRLTEEKWDYIKKISLIGNFIQEKKEEKIEYVDDEVKSFWEKIRKKREQASKTLKKEEKINLHSILSAVSWRTNGIDSLLDKTIYQLYDAYFRLGFYDNYHYIHTGIYTGNVDQSKIKLPDINWANVINIK